MSNNDIVPNFDNGTIPQLKLILATVPDIKNCILCEVSGQLDTWNSSAFQDRLELCAKTGYYKIILNMSGVDYISSTGIGALSFLQTNVKAREGNVVLFNLQPKVADVFRLLGFNTFFNITNTYEEAISVYTGKYKKSKILPFYTQTFPKTINCPFCNIKLRAVRYGKFRCSKCKQTFEIDEDGNVHL